MSNFKFMENTDEKQELVEGGAVVDDAAQHVEELVEQGQEESLEEPISLPDDDPTMRVLKQFPQVCTRIAEIMKEHAESLAMDLLQKGMNYDEAVANADKEGYLRGKNEKIELISNHRMPQLDSEPGGDSEEASQCLFPRYGKRSVWGD